MKKVDQKYARAHAPAAAGDIAPPTIYCINLKRSTARRQAMEARLKLLGAKHQFVDAVGSDSGLIKFYIKPHHKYEEEEQGKRTVACGVSHIKALRTFLETKETEALIAEDDICFHKDFYALYSAVRRNMPDNATLVSLCYLTESNEGQMWAGKNPDLHNLVTITPKFTWGGQLYWISRDYALKCLEVYDRRWYSLGWICLNEMYLRDSGGYLTRPLLAIEIGVSSDRMVNDKRAGKDDIYFPNWFDQWGQENYVLERPPNFTASLPTDKAQ